MTRARKIIGVVVLIFVIYAVLNSPEQSANVVKDAFGQIEDGIRAIGRFFDTLLRG